MFKLMDMMESPRERPRVLSGIAMDGYDKPSYPYGLSISLSDESMEKIGMKELPEIGEVVHFMAMAKVVSVNANATDEKETKCVSLQIIQMGLEEENKETDTAPKATKAKKLYDKKTETEDDEDE